MNVKPIRRRADHKAALKAVEQLMHAVANTPEDDRLDALVMLIEEYELVHYPMDSQGQRELDH